MFANPKSLQKKVIFISSGSENLYNSRTVLTIEMQVERENVIKHLEEL
jgi:hypothetical protein